MLHRGIGGRGHRHILGWTGDLVRSRCAGLGTASFRVLCRCRRCPAAGDRDTGGALGTTRGGFRLGSLSPGCLCPACQTLIVRFSGELSLDNGAGLKATFATWGTWVPPTSTLPLAWFSILSPASVRTMGTVGRIGVPGGLELGAGFNLAMGTNVSMIDCGGGLNPGGKITG
eukprot:2874945-Amphidinium_carterae.1